MLASVPRRRALERDRDVPQTRLPRSLMQQASEPLEDRAKLVKPERPDEDAPGVRSAALGPLPEQRCDVAAVARHENSVLGCRQCQHVGVGEALEIGSLAQRSHVVAIPTQGASDASTRQVGVEEQAHRELGAPGRQR